MSTPPQILSLIASQDEALRETAKFWRGSPPGDKSHWMDKINAMLDHRWELMMIRNAELHANPS